MLVVALSEGTKGKACPYLSWQGSEAATVFKTVLEVQSQRPSWLLGINAAFEELAEVAVAEVLLGVSPSESEDEWIAGRELGLSMIGTPKRWGVSGWRGQQLARSRTSTIWPPSERLLVIRGPWIFCSWLVQKRALSGWFVPSRRGRPPWWRPL